MDQRAVLFWVFVGFFICIGVVSLLTIIGIVKTEPSFRRWAIGSFITGVGGAVFGLFNLTFVEEVPLFITLGTPKEEGILHPLDLVSGKYNYDELTSTGSVHTSSGPVEITRGPGGLQVKLPQKVLNRAVELTFQDRDGHSWVVYRFYPNHNTQALVKGLSSSPSSAVPSAERTSESNAFAIVNLAFAQQQASLRFDNYAQQTEALSGHPSYKWRVFLNEPPEVLGTIAEVQYLLHPTFPEPLQVRTDPSTKFAVDASGWGEFTLLISVRHKDGRIEKTSYPLDLAKGWPHEEPPKQKPEPKPSDAKLDSAPVPFAVFVPKVEMKKGKLTVKGKFTWDADGGGIDPLNEDVTLELTGGTGAFSTTIPAGSFKPERTRQVTFEGTLKGVKLQARLRTLENNSSEFKFAGAHVNLPDLVNPVTVKLTIGNDRGNTSVTAKFK